MPDVRPLLTDDILTWPTAVQEFIARLSDSILASDDLTETCCSDLRLHDEMPALFDLLSDHKIRVYHATRLLPHEVKAIEASGLYMLDNDLVEKRLNDAANFDYLTNHEHDELLHSVTLGRSRASQVCFFTSRALPQDSPSAVDLLLSAWGGESIYWAHQNTKMMDRLRTIGVPTVVVADIGASNLSTARSFPDLINVFVATQLGLTGACADVHYKNSVPASCIEKVLTFADASSVRIPVL